MSTRTKRATKTNLPSTTWTKILLSETKKTSLQLLRRKYFYLLSTITKKILLHVKQGPVRSNQPCVPYTRWNHYWSHMHRGYTDTSKEVPTLRKTWVCGPTVGDNRTTVPNLKSRPQLWSWGGVLGIDRETVLWKTQNKKGEGLSEYIHFVF